MNKNMFLLKGYNRATANFHAHNVFDGHGSSLSEGIILLVVVILYPSRLAWVIGAAFWSSFFPTEVLHPDLRLCSEHNNPSKRKNQRTRHSLALFSHLHSPTSPGMTPSFSLLSNAASLPTYVIIFLRRFSPTPTGTTTLPLSISVASGGMDPWPIAHLDLRLPARLSSRCTRPHWSLGFTWHHTHSWTELPMLIAETATTLLVVTCWSWSRHGR